MTNKQKLESLYLNIDSKASLYLNAFAYGLGYGIRFSDSFKSSEYNSSYGQEAFRQYCLDFNLDDVVDGQYIDYVKLLMNPDEEYKKENRSV